jgi:hypothetical protein
MPSLTFNNLPGSFRKQLPINTNTINSYLARPNPINGGPRFNASRFSSMITQIQNSKSGCSACGH